MRGWISSKMRETREFTKSICSCFFMSPDSFLVCNTNTPEDCFFLSLLFFFFTSELNPFCSGLKCCYIYLTCSMCFNRLSKRFFSRKTRLHPFLFAIVIVMFSLLQFLFSCLFLHQRHKQWYIAHFVSDLLLHKKYWEKSRNRKIQRMITMRQENVE